MQLDPALWTPVDVNVHYSTGTLRVGDRPPCQALVEWIQYEEYWVGAIGEALFNSIGAVTELLRTTRSDKDMRVLSPIGYFHRANFHSFALAFHIPRSREADPRYVPKMMSLREYIEMVPKVRPPLEERILLARRIASTLARIHKVKWLHKGISAFGIVLPRTSPSDHPARIPSPYITGFNYSRPGNGLSSYNRAASSLEMTGYRHPEYTNEVRYQARFDYYSLGMVLLEIGLWRSLSWMTKGKEGWKPEPLLEYILESYVPKLDFCVGTKYREIVTRCLVGEVGLDMEDWDESGSMPANFEATETVEEQLANCLI